jgi:hypothetical protein
MVANTETHDYRYLRKVGCSEAGLMNKSSCLARTLGATTIIMVIAVDSVTLCCATYVGLRCSTNPPQRLAQALGVTKFIIISDMIWVTLCCVI